ncbi:MAG: protein disulfide oxidoreductase [Gammaproteobacteria bacterium]|nr:protein disulfide oxidoreductase [Gammaproteobacteria bacterium]
MTDTPGAEKDNRKPRRWLAWARDLALLAVAVVAVQWWQARDLAYGAAPPLVGHMLDGKPFQLEPEQGPYLVHFWAEWCPVCRLEQGSIAAIAADHPVITVATNSGTPTEVAAHLAREGVRFPVLMDETGAIARQWGVSGVPAAFIVGTDGVISHAGVGYSTEYGLRLRLWLAD